MRKHRYKIGVIVILLCGLCHIVKADINYSAWSQYEKAAQLFQENAPGKKIINLLETVQRETTDPVLVGRTAFLMSSVYERQNQLENAVLVLQKLNDPLFSIPPNMKLEAWLRMGRLSLKLGRVKVAENAFKKVLEIEGTELLKNEAILALALIAAEQDDWSTCDSLLSLITTHASGIAKDERIVILKARGAISANQPEQAIELLQQTESLTGLRVLADAYELADKQIMAVSVYKKIHDLYSNTPEAKLSLFQAAEVFMRAGDWLAANSEFKRLLSNVSDDALKDAIHFRLGWIYLNLKDYEKAITQFRSSAIAENASYFRYMEAECLRLQGGIDPTRLDQAILLFHNISSIDLESPLAPLAKLKAALTEMEKGDSTSARVSLRQFLNLYALDELTPAVYFLLGVNEKPPANQRYFDQIVQQNRNSNVFDVAFFAMQNQDFCHERYQKVITRNASLPQKNDDVLLNYWQRGNHLLLAESAYFLKHYQQALSEYQQVIGKHSDDLSEKAEIGKAWCLLQMKGPDSALVAFENIRKNSIGVNKILADYGYATVQFIRKDYETALRSYPVAIPIDQYPELGPVVVKSLYRSAQSYYRLEYYLQAIESWNKLAQTYPEDKLAVESLFNIADVYFRANYFHEADSVYQIIINRYPENQIAVESSLKLAQSAYNSGNYDLAVERYQSFIEQYPAHPKTKDALDGIQLSYYQIGQIDQASETLMKVIDQTSNSDLAIDARYRIALNYFQEKKYQEAIEAFKEILTQYPSSSYAVDAQFSLSKCYLAQEDYQAASQELMRFIQYFPNGAQIAEAHFLLGVSYYQTESYLSAIDYFSKIIQDYSDSEYYGPALKNSGWCYDRLKETDRAIHNFQQYVLLYPDAEDTAQLKLQIARLLNDTGKTDEAVIKFQEMQNVADPLVVIEASYRLGMIYLSQEQQTKAEKAFQTASNITEGDDYYRLSALAQLAALYENKGEVNKAIITYERLANSTSEERWTVAARERITLLQNQASSTQK
jgi:TolA-binding protein